MNGRVLAVLSGAAGLGVIFVIGARTGATIKGVVLLVPPGAHLLALGAFGADFLCRSARLVLLARATGEPLPLGVALRAQLAADAAAAVTPARSGSDPTKIWLMSRAGVSVPGGAAILVGEMLAEVAVLVAISVGLSALLPSGRGAALGALGYAAVVLTSTSGILLLAGRRIGRVPPRMLRRLPLDARRWRRLRIAARRFRRRAVRLRRLPASSAAALAGLTLAHIAARLAVLPALAAGMGSAPALGPLLGWPLTLLYTGAILPPPGGGGAIELGFTAALGRVLPGDTIAGALVWWRFYTFFLGALLGGIVLLLDGHWRRSMSVNA